MGIEEKSRTTSRSKNTGVSQERVTELFEYKLNGELVWRKHIGGLSKKGRVAGSVGGSGYSYVKFDGRLWRTHRIVFLWHNGYLPENEVDHVNKVRTDNRIENLREASPTCNMRNKGLMKNNKSGVKGVSFVERQKVWVASISIDSKNRHLGTYADINDAAFHRYCAEQCCGWLSCDADSTAYLFLKIRGEIK